MSATLILLNLAGDVGILLSGTYMVTSGVLRGYGTTCAAGSDAVSMDECERSWPGWLLRESCKAAQRPA